jgi:argininosuccinate lyase
MARIEDTPCPPAQFSFSLPTPELNFGAITLNSMDATSERDFVGES